MPTWKKYVSFLSCFWPNIYFPCGLIFSFYSSYIWAYLKACYPYILQVLSINKIESLNFFFFFDNLEVISPLTHPHNPPGAPEREFKFLFGSLKNSLNLSVILWRSSRLINRIPITDCGVLTYTKVLTSI